MQLGVVFGSVRHVNTEVGKCLVMGLQHNIVVHMCVYIYIIHRTPCKIRTHYIYIGILSSYSAKIMPAERSYQLDSDHVVSSSCASKIPAGSDKLPWLNKHVTMAFLCVMWFMNPIK